MFTKFIHDNNNIAQKKVTFYTKNGEGRKTFCLKGNINGIHC